MAEKEAPTEASSQQDATTNQDKPGGFFFNNEDLSIQPSTTCDTPLDLQNYSLSNFNVTCTSFALPLPAAASTNVTQLNLADHSILLDPMNSNAAMGVLKANDLQPWVSNNQPLPGPNSSASALPTGGVTYTDAATMATGALSGTAATEGGQKTGGFHLDTSRIQTTTLTDQSSELAALGLDVFNADQFEQGKVLLSVSLVTNISALYTSDKKLIDVRISLYSPHICGKSYLRLKVGQHTLSLFLDITVTGVIYFSFFLSW
jgi:hypothetical protein